MGKLFGTDGVRGIANTELTCELAYKLGRIGAYILTKGKKKAKIIVGKDTRVSGDMLEAALVAGILSAGSDAVCLGVVPTPAVSYLTRKYKADAGVVISASHNPVEYNGIKFFNRDGFKLPDEVEEQIEYYLLNNEDIDYIPTGNEIGKKIKIETAVQDYTDFLKTTIDVDLKGIKIAVDCANGAAYITAPKVLSELGAEINVINHNPNGYNINYKCGSTHPEVIKEYVLETGADFGLSFDGDADRLIAIDEKGNIVDGDKIMAICGAYFMEHGRLKNNTLVATVMSNIGLEKALKEYGCNVVKTKVGDRYVLEEMKKSGYVLGGEQSGHIIFLEHNTTGDGLLSALQLMAVVRNKNKPLSELASIMIKYPQVLKNAKVRNDNKKKYLEDEVIASRIKEIEKIFHGEGRVLIRPSGTEPLVRVMIEGNNKEILENYAVELVELIEKRLG
ncbi:phosphoglucosamine mutase [Paramaledivibacter caminithermalis]|jgi:phosphoglucosamine mutase|uniref:Phosphoglucosamine mutase n=1 Tax=Paramaledivibacter caminithermalis (strain DSM 15212 / CIP 107654 / DViRD3) TaxID=1121301 RepID=A0A1M6SUR2_PARC5|nr:phosphoglucosamine mutase [Paramaledivibacter caminithermalis]SHK48472.1 phosphoglucosamine mutase [Paramaledivibacter caminithermalis DSM 15212]